MSFQAMTWATEQELPAMQKIVLLMMANRTNHDTGLCFPSHDLLAKECGMEKRSVVNQIKKLESAGLLQVIRSKNDKKMNNVNKYILNLSVKAVKSGSERDSSGSERDSSGSERDSSGSERDSSGSERDSSIGSERDSLETVTIKPVKEPVKEPKEVAIAPNRTKEKTTGTRLSRDWKPSQEMADYCLHKRPDLILDDVVEDFIGYWVPKVGKDACKLDWDLTWQSWVRKQFVKQSQQKPRQSNNTPSAATGSSTGYQPSIFAQILNPDYCENFNSIESTSQRV